MTLSEERRDEETRLLIEHVHTGWASSLAKARRMIEEDDQ